MRTALNQIGHVIERFDGQYVGWVAITEPKRTHAAAQQRLDCMLRTPGAEYRIYPALVGFTRHVSPAAAAQQNWELVDDTDADLERKVTADELSKLMSFTPRDLKVVSMTDSPPCTNFAPTVGRKVGGRR